MPGQQRFGMNSASTIAMRIASTFSLRLLFLAIFSFSGAIDVIFDLNWIRDPFLLKKLYFIYNFTGYLSRYCSVWSRRISSISSVIRTISSRGYGLPDGVHVLHPRSQDAGDDAFFKNMLASAPPPVI